MTYKLNRIPNVEVLSIGGNHDIDLEEVNATIKVNDSCIIKLCHLSKDVFDYPRNVYINEFNGYIFTSFYPDYFPYSFLNIGTESLVGQELGLVFKSPRDVVSNIDKINDFINNLNKYPEINYFCDTASKTEMYLSVINTNHPDVWSYQFGFTLDLYVENNIFKSLKWKY